MVSDAIFIYNLTTFINSFNGCKVSQYSQSNQGMAGSQPLRWALVPTMWQNWSVSSLSLITVGTVVGACLSWMEVTWSHSLQHRIPWNTKHPPSPHLHLLYFSDYVCLHPSLTRWMEQDLYLGVLVMFVMKVSQWPSGGTNSTWGSVPSRSLRVA